jgi:DNA polymerase-3 subunit epsilon
LPECRSGGDDAAGRAREFNDTLAMMREIVFDTETTGLDPFQGDRMVEIGCIELVNRFPTGKTFHCYFNPERDMPEAAFKVHGLGVDFLKDKPLFAHKVEELTDFLGDCPLVAHNATFDFGFVNGELGRCGRPLLSTDRMIDTLAIARRRHPGAKHSLDALCTRYGIDRSHRVRHGALLDAELLAQVYVELTGGRQIGLELAASHVETVIEIAAFVPARREFRPPRPHAASAEELARHKAFVETLESPLWTS